MSEQNGVERTKTELRPCPFCGGKAHLQSDYSSEAGVTMWNVWHECDGFEGKGSGFGSALHPWFDTPWYESRDTAIDAWNRRADHSKCHVERNWDCDEPLEARLWRCDACGSEFVYESWLGPDYCPKCGREAV